MERKKAMEILEDQIANKGLDVVKENDGYIFCNDVLLIFGQCGILIVKDELVTRIFYCDMYSIEIRTGLFIKGKENYYIKIV